MVRFQNGYTTAHIAAMKGSVAVVRELMNLDRESVLTAATKVSFPVNIVVTEYLQIIFIF